MNLPEMVDSLKQYWRPRGRGDEPDAPTRPQIEGWLASHARG